MLSKEQLQTAAECCEMGPCRECLMWEGKCYGTTHCVEEAAKTALAYLELLEEAAEEIENLYGRDTTLSKRIREVV